MKEFTIGSIVPFGGYDWRILDIQGNAALIMTEDMIGQYPYNNCAGDVTWADCSLRKYLNGEFYNNFTMAEQSRILPVLNKNQDNQWYGSSGGEDTQDYIFLLTKKLCANISVTAVKTLKTAALNSDTGFKGKTRITPGEVPPLMGMYGGGGFGHLGVTIEEPYTSTATVI